MIDFGSYFLEKATHLFGTSAQVIATIIYIIIIMSFIQSNSIAHISINLICIVVL
jgi:hypothetical protein